MEDNMDTETKLKSEVAPNSNEIRLDKHGFPLVPQPSSSPMDPLNWSVWLKIAVLAQISCISFLSLLAAAMIVCALYIFWPKFTYQFRRRQHLCLYQSSCDKI